jgi:hypothetical protein
MTAFFDARLLSRRQRTTGERRVLVNQSENGDRRERVGFRPSLIGQK